MSQVQVTCNDNITSAPYPVSKRHYLEVCRPQLSKEFGYKNIMSVPRIERIYISMMDKRVLITQDLINKISDELMLISGQKPIITRAKKSIAGFKIKEGTPLGCVVTLRGNMLYWFLDKLIHLALPRLGLDFYGFSKKQFDTSGNFSMGIKDYTIFPEIKYDTSDSGRGMNINVVFSNSTPTSSARLLEMIGIPFA